MKKIISGILLTIIFGTAAFAQCNPGFGANPTYTGTSVVGGTQTVLVNDPAQLNFTFGVGSDPTCTGTAGNAAGNITMTISFSSSYGPASEADISGPMASLFDWVWDAAGHTLIGVNNAPIPVGPAAPFTVNIKGLAITPGTVAPLTTINWFSETNPPITNTDTNDDTQAIGLNVDAALPVTLVSFLVAKEGKQANLSWATTAETNSDRFEVEHSLNGKNWDRVGVVASNGESKSLKSYTFTDRNPGEGENLYRLRMVDKDETFAYSRIRSITFDDLNADHSVYPNPAVDKIMIRDYSKVNTIEISDLNGRMVMQTTKTASGEIDVKSVTRGMYVIKVTRLDGGINTQKVFIGK